MRDRCLTVYKTQSKSNLKVNRESNGGHSEYIFALYKSAGRFLANQKPEFRHDAAKHFAS